MMPEWHHLDSSSTMSGQQESVKKKTLKSSSRSFLFSTGLADDIFRCFFFLGALRVKYLTQMHAPGGHYMRENAFVRDRTYVRTRVMLYASTPH